MNAATLKLIRGFEGLELEAYRDPVGIWTIGYGHTSAAGKPQVVEGMRISKEQAEAILVRDVANVERAVAAVVTVPLNDNQFGALVSFAMNVKHWQTSSVIHAVNAKLFDDVPTLLRLYNHGGGRVITGLTKRRQAEGLVFKMPPAPETVDDA